MLKRAGRYEILAELGRGGFGQVYRAVDPTLDSMVAIKTLSVDSDASILARFRNEAAASRRLRHPNIVTIYDFGEQDGTPFIVMELLEGQDLQRVIESRRPLPVWHKVQIMTQVASGLANAHAHGIVHRDVKPANIMLLPDGNVKIMDFGIALVSQDTQNRLTPRGAVIGTFRYMAPEQFRGSQQDARGDIFAYGVMFYELLSGIHPFHAPEPAAAMYNILNLEPVPIRELCPECPEQLEGVIARLLQKDPEFRYQNLEDVLFDCEPVLLGLKHAQAGDLFEKVMVARGSGQLETAQTLLRQVMELEPGYPGARELREQLQGELRRSAVRPRVEALAAEAREQMGAGNPAEALVKFEAALRLDPSDYTLKSWLEQAKAALDQSRQVARLVAEAERALESGDLTGAHRIARQAVELAPAERRAREIVARTGATLAELERQTRLAADLARARRLIEISSWDESSSLLDQLQREFPKLGEIVALREILEAGKLAERRQQKLSAGLAAARQEIQGRSLQAASTRLAALRSEFPSATDVEQLLRYVTSELEADRQREVIDRSLSESRALSERNRFADAAKILETALASYPTHPLLQRELRSVTIALHQAERDAALSQALSSAKELQAHGTFEAAMESLDSFSSKYGSEPAIDELRRNIERDREAARRAAELRKMVLRINDLLSQDKAEEATVLLQTFPTPIKNAPELTQLRVAAQAQLDRQRERRAALDEALSGANARRQQNDFDAALQMLAAFTARYGAEPKIAELDKSIRQEKEESQRRADERRGLVNRANKFLAEGKAAEATQLLQSRPAYLRDDSEVTKILQAADLQVREQAEREAALQAAIGSAVSSQKQGRFDEAMALLNAFLRQYGPDDRVVSLQQAIETERVATQAQLDRQRERRAALDEALSGADAHRRQGGFDPALQILAAFTARYGAEPKIAELDKSIRQEKEESQRRAEERRGLMNRANEFLAQGMASEATQLLQSRPAYLRDDSEVTKILEAADLQVRKQAEREAALQAAIGSAVSSQKQGRFDEAMALLNAFLRQYGPDDRVVSLQQAIETERVAAQTQLERQRERRAALDEALSGADAHRRQGGFDPALQMLAAFTARYGAEPKIAELDKSIRREKEESQRRAEERRGLVNRANKFLAEGKAAEATQLLQSRPAYLRDDSEVTKILEVADLQVRKEAEREAALQAAIGSAVSSQKQGRFDEAMALLNAFLRQYGPDDRVVALQQAIETEREAARRAAEIRELETRARSLLEQNKLEAAVALLKQAPSLVKESSDLRELLSGAETALAAKQTRELIEATLAEARSQMRRGEFQAALEVINRGLQRFPSEAALTTARAEALAAQATKERGEYLARVIGEVNSLIAKHDYGRAFRVHEEALGKLSGDPQLQALKAEIEAHQRDWESVQIEQKIQDTVRRARELLAGKPAESVALLERLCAQNPNRGELIAQLGEAQEALRQAAERELIRESESLCQKNKFSEAIAKLGQADRQTPELEAARQRAESRWAAAVNERIAKGIQSARKVAERKPSQALHELEKLRLQFPGRPEIESAIEEYRQVLLAQQRALEEARRAAASDLAGAVNASPVAEQQPDIRPARRPALISNPRMMLAAALILAAVLSAAVWWIAHSRRVHPAIALVPLEVRTDPVGASVRIGDQSCVTPKCQLDMPPGTYNVDAQLKGYEPLEQNLQVTGSHPASLDLTLRPLPAPPPPASAAGRLTVQAGLADVLVIVDNLPRGRTDASGAFSVPLEAKKTYAVRVEKPGYETGHDQLVKIGERATETVVFKLSAQMATLELRGAPAGVELRAGGRLIGRTSGSPFSANLPPGDQVLRVTEGSASREISQRFEPGKMVALEWASVAPTRIVTPPPTAPPPASPPKPNQPDPAEQAWSRVDQNDLTSLRDYLNRFRDGPHARDASRRIADLVWNGVNQKDEQGVRSFVEQNPDSPYKSQAQAILDQFEKQRLDAEERLKQERARQEEANKQLEEANKQSDSQRGPVLAALDRFNAAFAQHKQKDLKAVWPAVPQSYIEALKTTSLLTFVRSQVVNITGDVASVNSNLAATTAPPHPPQPVTVTLQKQGGDWIIVKLEKR
jgi:serine/threonine-protein kinase